MERPKITSKPPKRPVTGEIVYLDLMRQQEEYPDDYPNSPTMTDESIADFETTADALRAHGVVPDILAAYEAYDIVPDSLTASCIALADELLALKEPNSRWTFVDIKLEMKPDLIIERLESVGAAELFASPDEQLAIESGGSYYPKLDIRKRDATFAGAGLRVYGWDERKLVHTTGPDEPYEFPRDVLIYPSSEKNSRREFEIIFFYDHPSSSFCEVIKLSVSNMSGISMSRNINAAAYAETGYEGHAGRWMKPTKKRVTACADLIAEMVGDVPRSVDQYVEQNIQTIREAAASSQAVDAINRLLAATWPAQCNYFLVRPLKDTSLAELLRDDDTVAEAIEAIDAITDRWNQVR